MSAVRAVVLARGRGSRMREADASAEPLDPRQAAAADRGAKAMMPFDRPFLDYVLHEIAEAGIRHVALVVGPEPDEIRAHYTHAVTRRLSIDLVTQQEPRGTADAVASAEPWTMGEPFLVMNADNLYPSDVLARLAAADGPALPGFEAAALALPPSRLGAFALLERDSRGCLSRIVEKPGERAIQDAGPSALISMNVWRFDARIFNACRNVPVSSRGERELPQAVGYAASHGVCFEVIPVAGRVLDLSRRRDVPRVAEALRGRSVDL